MNPIVETPIIDAGEGFLLDVGSPDIDLSGAGHSLPQPDISNNTLGNIWNSVEPAFASGASVQLAGNGKLFGMGLFNPFENIGFDSGSYYQQFVKPTPVYKPTEEQQAEFFRFLSGDDYEVGQYVPDAPKSNVKEVNGKYFDAQGREVPVFSLPPTAEVAAANQAKRDRFNQHMNAGNQPIDKQINIFKDAKDLGENYLVGRGLGYVWKFGSWSYRSLIYGARIEATAAEVGAGALGRTSVTEAMSSEKNLAMVLKDGRWVVDSVAFGRNLNTTVALEGRALIALDKTAGVAISRAGIPELRIEGDAYQNIAFSMQKGRSFPGTVRFGENLGFIRITDQKAYIKEIMKLYSKAGNDLNPVIKDRIMAHAKNGAEFSLQDARGLKGIPGLHAEVQAANHVLNQANAVRGFDVSKVQVSTYRLKSGPGQGNSFIACNHCSGILKGFSILTGH